MRCGTRELVGYLGANVVMEMAGYPMLATAWQCVRSERYVGRTVNWVWSQGFTAIRCVSSEGQIHARGGCDCEKMSGSRLANSPAYNVPDGWKMAPGRRRVVGWIEQKR